jgi:uncharacterized protein YecA (UPF0149 family)
MLLHHIEGATQDLKDLIKMTEDDIKDIKAAKRVEQFERIALKDEKIKGFEAKKSMIDHEISKLIKLSPDIPMQDLLNAAQQDALDSLKSTLQQLRDINQRYAKMVLAVGSFYNSLLEQLMPTEMEGYQRVTSKDPTFLETRV